MDYQTLARKLQWDQIFRNHMRIELNAYEHQHHGSINQCIPHSLSLTLLIMSLEDFVYRIAKFLAQVRTCINHNWHYSYHILGHVRSHNKRHVCVLNNCGILLQRSVCPWVNEDRFKRKWILSDIKQSTQKQHSTMVWWYSSSSGESAWREKGQE